MPIFFNTYETEVVDGVVVSSTLITAALYAPGEVIDPGDGASLRIIDDNSEDGLISRQEFRDATGGGGLGLNGGVAGPPATVWDGTTGSTNIGFLYSPTEYSPGDNVDAVINALPSNFPPIDPGSLAVPCFTTGTLIDTPSGPCPVERLVPGNAVSLYPASTHVNSTSQILVEIVRRRISSEEIKRNPKLCPVRITAGALGEALPKRDLIVSRQHRMLVCSKVCRRMFGENEVLVAAIKLTALPGVYIDETVTDFEYFQLIFEKHEVIYAEGAPTESFFPGPQAIKALPREAREELFSIFPDMEAEDFVPMPVRLIPEGRLQRKLLERHLKNDISVLTVGDNANSTALAH